MIHIRRMHTDMHISKDLDRLFIIQILHHVRKMLNRVRQKGQYIKTKTLQKKKKIVDAMPEIK